MHNYPSIYMVLEIYLGAFLPLLKEKLSAFEQKANNRFELTEKFLKYNIELANEGTNEEKLHLFKKVGSNFQIKDRTVLFEPRGAWRILAESGFCGGNTEQTALRADHIFDGNLNSEFWRRGRDLISFYGNPAKCRMALRSSPTNTTIKNFNAMQA